MSTTLFIQIFAWSLLFAAPAFAILPPDAAARAPEIRAGYARSARAYEERQQQRQIEAVEQYKKTEADIFTPPWMRTGTQAALSGVDPSLKVQAEKSQKGKNRFLVSVVLLILIGGAVWWVRIATEPES